MFRSRCGVFCFWAIFLINRIECIKLTPENVISLVKVGYNGELHNFRGKNISEIDPTAFEVINSTT